MAGAAVEQQVACGELVFGAEQQGLGQQLLQLLLGLGGPLALGPPPHFHQAGQLVEAGAAGHGVAQLGLLLQQPQRWQGRHHQQGGGLGRHQAQLWFSTPKARPAEPAAGAGQAQAEGGLARPELQAP